MSTLFKHLNLNDTFVNVEVSGHHTVSDIDEERSFKSMAQQLTRQLEAPAPFIDLDANKWWGGESMQVRGLKYQPKVENGVDVFNIAVDGPEALVFKQENEYGTLLRYWVSRDSNITARIKYVNTPSHQASWHLSIYLNQRFNKRWSGKLLGEHWVHRTITQESELTVAKWVAIYFARYSN